MEPGVESGAAGWGAWIHGFQLSLLNRRNRRILKIIDVIGKYLREIRIWKLRGKICDRW